MRLELTKGRKLYWVDVVKDKRSVVTTSGHIGVHATRKRRSYKTDAAVNRSYEKQIAELIAAGYRDIDANGVAPAADAPRNPVLEAAIRANPGDPAAYDVYADWLQQQGSTLGELIALSRANKSTRVSTRVKKLVDTLGLPGVNLATFGWRWGMWEWLRLENNADWLDGTFDAPALANRVFAQPMCAALEELRIGVLRWEDNYEDVPAVLDEAKRYDWAPYLARLRLGDVEGIDMAHHTIGDVGKRISKAFPRLRSLVLHSGVWEDHRSETFGVGGLVLNELRELVIETCTLNKARLSAVLSAKLPALHRLELWFGSGRYGCNTTAGDLKRLLSGKVHGGVVQLGLRNAEFTNELAFAVPTAAIAGRLEALDLSMGTLTDEGANALIAGRKAFGRLEALSVADNFLTPAGARAVRKAFPFAATGDQKLPDNSIAGETYYYVSVSE